MDTDRRHQGRESRLHSPALRWGSVAPPLRFRWRLTDGRMAFVLDYEHDSPRDLHEA